MSSSPTAPCSPILGGRIQKIKVWDQARSVVIFFFLGGCFQKLGGKPKKFMVYFMEKPIQMDDLGAKPPIFWKHPGGGLKHVSVLSFI